MDSKQKNEGLKFSKGAQEAMPARSTTVVFTPRSARWYEIETPMTPLLLMSSHVYAARVLLSLSHWPALTSLNKKHVPAICLPSSCKWNLSRIWVVLKKNRRWRAVISQGKKGWSPTTFSIHCRQTRHALWQISQHPPEMRQGTSAQNENRFVIPAASLSGGLSARIPTNGVL